MFDGNWYVGKETLPEELFKLIKNEGYRIIAPVKRGKHHIFEEVYEFNEIDLDYIRAVNNPRHFLQPPDEHILK